MKQIPIEPPTFDPSSGIPRGFVEITAYTNGKRIVICEQDGLKDIDKGHNCDAMGCGSVSPHVIVKIDLDSTDGVEAIKAERLRQIEKEGWTAEHDAAHDDGQLAYAAECYLMRRNDAATDYVPGIWPWAIEWWKPSADPIRNLEKAGALIAAEIDRLKRAKFAPWLAELKRLLVEKFEFTAAAAETYGDDSYWREFFDDGYTPTAAIQEDLSRD